MGAEVEIQRVAIMGKSSWEEFRAVCHDHEKGPDDDFLAPWMSKETHPHWIDARLDAVEHDAECHPRPKLPSWDEIMKGMTPEVEPLLSAPPRPLHALR